MRIFKIIVFFCIFTSFNHKIMAQEIQLSFGADFNFSLYNVDNIIFHPINSSGGYIFTEDTLYTFFSPGLSFLFRIFPETDSKFIPGFVYRSRALLAVNGKVKGYFNDGRVSEHFTLDDILITTMDFGAGISSKFILSDRFSLYADLGINLTVFDFEDDEKSTHNYLGGGIFSDISLQFNMTQKIYLELGINSVLSIFSSQKGQFMHPYYTNQTVRYEDTGRRDLTMIAPYIHIGWRFDLKQFRRTGN